MTVELVTFGFKTGAPHDADLTVDVRALPNPFYEPELRELTGCDAAIAAFFESRPAVQAAVESYYHTIRRSVEAARERGEPLLQVAIGCTGGQHRSVYVAERVAERLRSDGIAVSIRHRELASP
jgi:UPF0042 nucleotide-binding protein